MNEFEIMKCKTHFSMINFLLGNFVTNVPYQEWQIRLWPVSSTKLCKSILSEYLVRNDDNVVMGKHKLPN